MTFRSYPDRVASSANGRYRLEASSPQNQPGHEHYGLGHQTEFGYRLVDVARGRTLWQCEPQKREPSPVEMCVSDDGFVVVRAHDGSWADESLLVFDREGQKRLVVIIAYAPTTDASDDEPPRGAVVWRDPHVIVSTAGPEWVGASLPYFAPTGRASFFCWRPWWGRRIVIDLERMRLLDDDETTALVPRLADTERAIAIASLDAHVASVARGDRDFLHERRVLGSLLAAGEHGVRDAIPFARALEHVPSHRRSWCDALGLGWSYDLARIRAIARRTLRMLGEEPTCGGDVRILRELSSTSHELVPAQVPIAPGSPHAHLDARSLAIGDSALHVLARVGAPDWIGRAPGPRDGEGHYRRELWEYDGLDSTTRITWSAPANRSRDASNAPRVIDAIEIIPPRWSTEERLAGLASF